MTRVIRWTPVNRVRSPFDNFVNELWNTLPNTSTESVEGKESHEQFAKPAMDIIENEAGFEVAVNLPGVAPEDVNIEFDKGVLTISTAVHEAEAAEGEESPRYTRRERFVGPYRRTLRVPETIDTEGANASFENGVLYLTLPKRPEAQPVRIPVNVANN